MLTKLVTINTEFLLREATLQVVDESVTKIISDIWYVLEESNLVTYEYIYAEVYWILLKC